MSNRLAKSSAFLLAMLLGSSAVFSQTASRPEAAPSPKPLLPAGAPDLSGNWLIAPGKSSWDPSDEAGKNPEQMPMTPWARAKLKAARPPFGANETFENTNDPVQRYCDPPGLTRLYTYPWQFTIVQTPGAVYLLYEYFHIWRVVAMNQAHNTDVDSTWLGDSVGKYEGDTLVIDTIGLNDKSWLDQVGHPHSDKLHTIERLRRVDHDTLQLELTVDDPTAYTKVLTSKRLFKWSSFPLGETMCSLSETQAFQKNIINRTNPPPKK